MADVVIDFRGNADDLLSTLSAVGGGVTAAGAAVAAFAQQVADLQNELTDTAARTGIAIRQIAGLKLAAEGSGQSLQELEGVLRKVTAEGLNINEVVDTIQSFENPTQRAAAAMELLGEEGGRLAQALGDTRLQAFSDFATTFGLDTGPRATQAAADWQRAMAELTTVTEGFVSQAGTPLLETLTTLTRSFTRGAIFAEEVLGGAIGLLGDIVNEVIEDLGALGRVMIAIAARDVDMVIEAIGGAVKAFEEVPDPARQLEEALAGAFEKVDTYNRLVADMAVKNTEATNSLRALSGELENVAPKFVTSGEAAEYLGGVTVDTTIPAIRGLGEESNQFRENAEDSTSKAAEAFIALGKQVSAVGDIGRGVGEIATWIGDQFTEGSKAAETAAKVAFAANKAAAIGDIVVKTAQSIMAAMTIPPPAGPILAGINAAVGATQLATVAATSFGGGGNVNNPSSAAASGQAAAQAASSEGISGPRLGADPDGVTLRRTATTGGAMYRHRDLDVVSLDAYPGSAMDRGSFTGQRRYDRGN